MNGLREYLSKPSLAELTQELRELTQYRNEVITLCAELSREMNTHYDERALELSREIAKLDPPVTRVPTPVAPKPRAKRVKKLDLSGMDDWTPEDIAHFKELAAR